MAKSSPHLNPPAWNQFWLQAFSFLIGIFLALILLKLGNPVIFEDKFPAPTDIFELIFQPWPFTWGYVFIAILVAIGFKAGKWRVHFNRTAAFGLFLPLIWLGWQFVAATQTVDANLTSSTLKHFTACVACFYLGWFGLSEARNFRPIYLGILVGLSCVIITGWQQHFGGLEQTRRFFYELPDWREYPPDFIKKVSSNRIYSTLFYPNTLAAAILLFFPISIACFWEFSSRWSIRARGLFVGLLSMGALGCLFWSGSKSGWLLALFLGFLCLLQLRFNPALKKGLIITLLIVGIGGFAAKYAGFFQRGATSVVARFDYWRAAVEITKQNPVLGTGPGTFFVPYQKIKKPEAEMARLCHNDYLQQASDSGLVGFLSFSAFICGSLFFCRPKPQGGHPLAFVVWLGLAGVALHSFVDFNLYIPAIAWPMFLFLGWLWSQRVKEIIDNKLSAP